MRRGLGALPTLPLLLTLLVGVSAAGTEDVGWQLEPPVVRIPLQKHLDGLFQGMEESVREAQREAVDGSGALRAHGP